jgi:hypothetical protein
MDGDKEVPGIVVYGRRLGEKIRLRPLPGGGYELAVQPGEHCIASIVTISDRMMHELFIWWEEN